MPPQPPPFAWNDWYAGIGGRTIHIDEVDSYLKLIFEGQYPRMSGEVAPERVGFGSPEEAARAVKEKAAEFGADIVGVCEIGEEEVYRGCTVPERYAIALGGRMLWREFQQVPSERSAVECLRVYHDLGETIIALAGWIRSLGWECTVEHPIGDTRVLHIPIALKAGFGELGRHGSIINPTFGPLFRIGCILTDLPLAVDAPIDAGIAKFCDTCRACRRYCPADAIPDTRDPDGGVDHLGNLRYRVDTGRCFPYFACHGYCSICLPVCVYNHREWARDFEGHQTGLWPQIEMVDPPPPFDGIAPEERHRYPLHNREAEG